MSRKILMLLLLAIACLSAFDESIAQTIPRGVASWPNRWDASHKVLFLGVGVITRKGLRLIHSYENGIQRGSDIDILKDFPDIEYGVVQDISASTAGTTVIAADLISVSPGGNAAINSPEGKTARHVILTYDSNDQLRAVWNLAPYYAIAITTDDLGNVYTIGEIGQGIGSKPYPLLVVYDPSGKGISEGLNSNVFKNGTSAFDDITDEYGAVSLSWVRGKLYIYAPTENEAIVCAGDGAILTQTPLGGVMQDIARFDGVESAEVWHMAFVDSEHAAINVNEYEKNARSRTLTDTTKIHSNVYLVDLRTMKYQLIDRLHIGTHFLGIDEQGLILESFSPSGDGTATIQRFNLPQ